MRREVGLHSDHREDRSANARQRSRHSPHFYLALACATTGVAAAALNLWAYYDEGRTSTWIGFGAACVASLVLFVTWFWGTFLVMNGLMPRARVVYLAIHALIGSLTPLLYVLGFGLQLDTLDSQPVGETQVLLYLAALPIIALQFVSGWSVLPRLRWLRFTGRR